MNQVTFFPSLYGYRPVVRKPNVKTTDSTFRPAYNVIESATHFELQLALPGVAKDEVSIKVEKDQLEIAGERKAELEEGLSTNFEGIAAGNFRRVFSLPDTVQTDSIEATMENGILKLRLPKQEKAQPRSIAIA